MIAASTLRPDPTAASELGRIVRLAQPIAIAQVGLVLMGLVDTAVLGQVSSTELAGASLGRNIGFTSQTIAIGIAMALEPLSSQAVGEGRNDKAWASLVATYKALALIWAPAMALAVGATFLLAPLGIEPDIIPAARTFVLAQAPGVLFFSVFLAQKTFLQAHSSTRPALIASVVANVINFGLCNALIRGDDAFAQVGLPRLGFHGLGALGAGVSTSLATFVLTVILFYAAKEFRPAHFARAMPVRVVLRLGIPSGLHVLAEVGCFALVSILTGRFGKVVVAANQIAIGLASFTFMAALGVSGATAVRVGHRIGEGGSPRQAGLLGIGVSVAVMSAGALAFSVFPRHLVGLFTGDPDIIALGARLLRVAAVFQLFDGVQAVGAGALRGAGDVRYVLFTGVLAYWVVGVPLALVFGFALRWGAVGMWWGLTLSLVTAAVMFVARFLILTRRPVARVV